MTDRKQTNGPPRRDRSGIYTLPDGTRCMSVTTIIGNGVPKPALVHWAAIEVARCAVDHLPKLSRVRGAAAREEAFQWLRRAAERKRDTAANLGSTVHDLVEATILGQPFPDPTDEQAPFLDAYTNFVDDHQPVFESTELVLAHPGHGWAGRGDAWATLPALGSGLALIDWKSGRGTYAEAALQLSCYRRATIGWLKDGTEIVPPETDRAYVVHLRPEKYPDRGYAIYPVDTSDEVYEHFRAAQSVAQWGIGLAKTAIGEPIELPDTDTAEVA